MTPVSPALPAFATQVVTPPGRLPARRKTVVMAVTSGKGGVGKTFFAANLACGLAKRGKKVLLIDADLGLANLDVVLNLHAKVTLNDVLAGTARAADAIVAATGGFSVILAGSGKAHFAQLTDTVRSGFVQLLAELAALPEPFDIILLDTGAGISDTVLFIVSLAAEVIVVATPEPTSLTDAYATVKVLVTEQHRRQVRLVVNQTARLGDGRAITTQLQQVLDRFVATDPGQVIRLLHLGDIPADPQVRQAVMRRQLLLHTTPACPASLALLLVAVKVDEVLAG